MDSSLTFEAAMKRLDEITLSMEKSDIPLDESLKLYSEAVELAAFCRKYIEQAKQKISSPELSE